VLLAGNNFEEDIHTSCCHTIYFCEQIPLLETKDTIRMSGPPAQGYKISGEGHVGGGPDGSKGGNTVREKSVVAIFF
jgi:hypothetical protein